MHHNELERLRDRFDSAAPCTQVDSQGRELCPYCGLPSTLATQDVVHSGYTTAIVARCSCGHDYAISR